MYTMKRLLPLVIATAFSTAAAAQSFEWDTPQSAVPAPHPKEVVVEREKGTAGVYSPAQQGKKTAYGETYDATEMTGSHPALPLGTLLRVTNTENGRTVVVRVTDKGSECENCLVTLSEVAARELGIADRGTVNLERAGFSNWNPQPPAAVSSTDVNATLGVVAPRPQNSTIAPAPQPTTPNQPKIIEKEVVLPAETSTPPTFARRVTIAQEQPVVNPPTPTVTPNQQARGSELPNAPVSPTTTATAAMGDYAVQLAAYNNASYALRRVEELKQKGLTDVYYRSVTKADGQVINRVYAGTFNDANAAQEAAREIQGKYNIAGIVAKM